MSTRPAIAKTKAETSAIDVNAGLIPFEALVKGRCNRLVEDGTYPGPDLKRRLQIRN